MDGGIRLLFSGLFNFSIAASCVGSTARGFSTLGRVCGLFERIFKQ
jgi:hypothetical protein